MQENKFYTFSTYNFINKYDETENEDSFYTDNFSELAIADGAGGVGVFNKNWSQFLVNNFFRSNLVVKEEWENWFKGIAENFYNNIIEDNRFTDTFVNQKFFEEGSYSTYLQLKIINDKNELFYWGCGDTILLIFTFDDSTNEYSLKELYPNNFIKSINENPDLLNWNSEIIWNTPKSIKLSNNDIIVCCTDSLFRFFIQLMFNFNPLITNCFFNVDVNENLKFDSDSVKIKKSPTDLVNFLLGFYEDKNDKIGKLKEYINDGLEPDDFTLITFKYCSND